MAQTVIGMFDSAAQAQEAVESLTANGISRSNIDVSNSGSGTSSVTDTDKKEESGIGHFFRNLFSDDDDTEKYTTVAKRSQAVVTVHAQDAEQAEEAADILDECGAVDVDEKAAYYGYSGNSNKMQTGDFATTGDAQKIPIIEENLEVGKRQVQTGGVRLRSRVVEKPVEESLRLREENVRVERTSVNREATSNDLANFGARDIEMTESAEVPVVSKTARVVEEVSLAKEVNERTETVSDTVRKTEVDVEDLTSANYKKDVD